MPRKSRPARDSAPVIRLDAPLSIDSIEQVKAIADPLRLQLLEQFAAAPATTKQVATTLGLPPTRLYHHVSRLEKAGLIRLVETRKVRGSMEKYFSAVSKTLKIDRQALQALSTRLVNDIAGLRVVESLLDVVRQEVALYLSTIDADRDSRSAGESVAEEVVFVGAEVFADPETVKIIRNKINALVEELNQLSEQNRDAGGDGKKHRLLLGWYPRPEVAAGQPGD